MSNRRKIKTYVGDGLTVTGSEEMVNMIAEADRQFDELAAEIKHFLSQDHPSGASPAVVLRHFRDLGRQEGMVRCVILGMLEAHGYDYSIPIDWGPDDKEESTE